MAPMIVQEGSSRLSMRGICKTFGATVALDRVNFDLGVGEIHALVGENGAGKSTLMKILSGALVADSGSIVLDKKPFAPSNTHNARMAGVTMIYQELSLAPHLSVAENILLGVEPHRWGFVRKSAVLQRTRDALAQLDHADIPDDMKVGFLPLAKRQVVEIARALATGCRVLVLDEPTSSLSQQDIERLFVIVRRLSLEGTSIIYISHILEEVKRISDRLTVLRDGRSVWTGSTAETAPDAIIGHMVGRRIDEMYPRSGHTVGEPLLEVRDLGGKIKPRSAGFSLHRGEVLGIAGLVGAGRTELLRVVFGLDPIRTEAIKVGMYSGYAGPPTRWAQGVGIVSEDRNREGLALQLTIADNISMNLSKDRQRFGFIAPKRLQRAAADLIQLLGIRSSGPLQKVESLSGGNQQKVAVARLLHQDVDVVLLDEPTRGIDVSSKSQLYALIDRMALGDPARGVKPKAILIVSSYLPELLGICDRVAVMCRGVLGTPKSVSEVDQHSLMAEATGQRTIA